ncbi:hypothetical protein [Geodermatophilus sp. SYSU D01036]
MFDATDWLPLVDDSEYDPEMHRAYRLPDRPPGPTTKSLAQWRQDQAESLWTRARLDWCQRFGWPGGLDIVELMQQMVAGRRQSISRPKSPHSR